MALHFFLLISILFKLSDCDITASLSQPRDLLAATAVDNLALFAGGWNQGGSSALVDIYNITSNAWSTANLSQPRNTLVATSVGHLALFAGGYNGTGNSDRVDIYNSTSNTWSIATLSQARTLLAATSVGNLALFGGGSNATGNSDQVDIYNFTSNTWSTAILSQPRNTLVATSVGHLALFAGGDNDTTLSDRVDIYDVTSSSWRIATLSQGRWNFAATSVGNLALFAGGQTQYTDLSNQLDIYDATYDVWSTASLSQGRNTLAATSGGHLALFAGGYAGEGAGSTQVDIYNFTSNTWSTASLFQGRIDIAATSVGNLAIFGGGNCYGPSSQLDIFCVLDSACYDDSIFCNGPEICSAGLCVPSGDPCFNNNVCNNNICNETGRNCFIPAGIPCNNGIYCDGMDACDGQGNCSIHSGDPCKTGPICNNTCSEVYKNCIAIGTNCSNGTICTAEDICNELGNCIHVPTACSSSPEIDHSADHSSHKSIGIIVGPIVAGIVFLLVIIAVPLLLRYKRRRHFQKSFVMNVVIQEINNITIMERLGGGQFGDVYRGILDTSLQVALKKLKSTDYTTEFQQEVAVLTPLNHPNIVRFYGIHKTSANEVYMVFEFLSEGSLAQLLQSKKEELHESDLISMSKQALSGLEYLETNHIVHRDLALRNLLVGRDQEGKYIVKVSDFGMSRAVDKGYYKTNSKLIPVKWSAPEVIEYGISTSKSDVWSFGICLWELFSYGKLPYGGFSNEEVIEKVTSGYRLPAPPNCPKEVYNVMLFCWESDPEKRISFAQLSPIIDKLWSPQLPAIPQNSTVVTISTTNQDSVYV